MNFCIECGNQLEPGGKFCVQCGTRVPVSTEQVESQTAPLGTSPGNWPGHLGNTEHTLGRQPTADTQPYPSQPQSSASDYADASHDQARGRTAASLPRQSAFSGVGIGDYVRDAISAFALIISLFMVWKYATPDSDSFEDSIAGLRVDVVLISLLSLLSLSISYMWRAGIFGTSWNYLKTQDARLLANAPYVVMVLVYLVIELVTAGGFGMGGLGPALSFGLAGALLAAQPRAAETVADRNTDIGRNKRWLAVVIGIAALVVLLTLVQSIELLVRFSESTFLGSNILSIVMGLASAAVLVVIALGIYRRSNGWRLVGIGLGIGTACLGLLSLIPEMTLLTLRFAGTNPHFSMTFWMAFGVAASAPSLRRLVSAESSKEHRWLDALTPTLHIAVVLSAVIVLGSGILLIVVATQEFAFVNVVPWVLALFFGALFLVGGIIARVLRAKDPRAGHLVATAYAGLVFVLGLVLMIMWAAQGLGTLGPVTLLMAFILPTGILTVLWAPASSRNYFRSLQNAMQPGQTGFSFDGPQATRPAQTAAPRGPGFEQSEAPIQDQAFEMESVTPSHRQPADLNVATAAAALAGPQEADYKAGDSASYSILLEASSPNTHPQRLHEIAATAPHARAAIAANPATYPELLQWLGQLGEPEVNEALQQRVQ